MSAIGALMSVIGNAIATDKTNQTNWNIAKATNQANLAIAQSTNATNLQFAFE